MGLSNLPPGVTDNMIPGNRPEDALEEAFWNALFEKAPSDKLPEEWWEDEGITELVRVAHELAFHAGYGQGQTDAYMEMSQRELDRQEGIDS